MISVGQPRPTVGARSNLPGSRPERGRASSVLTRPSSIPRELTQARGGWRGRQLAPRSARS
jgi:hypothetical protein